MITKIKLPTFTPVPSTIGMVAERTCAGQPDVQPAVHVLPGACAWVHGRYFPQAEITLSVLDGFNF